MSVTGVGTLSIRKQDVREQKDLAVGFKKIVFAHKATLGATGIVLTALTIPTEMSSVGFTNPSTAELSAAQILFYRKNLILTSSIRGVLMDFLSYNVSTSNTIDFNGFTAADGEIFIGTIDYNARNGSALVDAAPLVATGTLAVGSTDFNVGQVYTVGLYTSAQVGAVIVYRNGVQQFRNTNNSSTTLDGNYYEVNNGSGLGSIIRFNTAPPVVADSILVVSNGLLAYNPDGSAIQKIENIAGQIANMIPTLSDLAGVPTSTFSGAATNVDLKSFGDSVLSALNRLTALEAGPAITTVTATGSGVYNVPAGAKWLRVRMTGAGGGGGSSGTSGGGNVNGSDGNNTTWAVHSGSIFVTAGLGGRGFGGGNSAAGGAGGTNTISAPAIAVANIAGGLGHTSGPDSAQANQSGGMGGANPFGGAGYSTYAGANGGAGQTNTGAGGAGASTGGSAYAGIGAGAGGYVEFIIQSPSASYDYVLGAGGAGGATNSGGFTGGAGAAGIIIIEAYS